MTDDVSIDIAQLAGLFLESILYGVYLITIGQVFSRILRGAPLSERKFSKTPFSKVHLPTLLVALLLWVNGTLNLGLALHRTILQHIYNIRGGPSFDWIGSAKLMSVSVQFMLADGILVYRCWKVYKQWKIIIFPVLLWLVAGAASICTVYFNLHLTTKGVFVGMQYQLQCIFWSLTMALNVYTTSCIVYRIWKVNREACARGAFLDTQNALSLPIHHFARRKNSRLQGIIKIVVMSGLIHTLTSITVVGSAIVQSNAVYITSAADILAIGIAYNLMIIWIDRERAKDEEWTTMCTQRISAIRFEGCGRQFQVPTDCLSSKCADPRKDLVVMDNCVQFDLESAPEKKEDENRDKYSTSSRGRA